MKIVVTGATGFIGRALVLRLLRDRHDVTALVRSVAAAPGKLGAGVAVVDLADRAARTRAVEQADAIINLAGENILDGRWTAARKQALRASRLDTTRALVDAIAARATPLPVLVSASAVGWYGDRGDDLLDEDEPPATNFTATLVRDWEAAAHAARAHCGRVVLARIGVVLGAGGGALATLAPLFRCGLGGPIAGGKQWMPWIHLDDVVEALVFALTSSALDGPVNLVAPNPATNRQVSAAVGAALHRPSWLPTPGFAVRLTLGARAHVVLDSQRVRPTALERAGFEWRHPDLGEAVTEALVGEADAVQITGAPGHLPDSAYLAERRPRYTLRSTTIVDRPLEEVFEFFSAAQNLGAITPADMAFTIAGAVPAMAPGAVIDYRVRALGVTLAWRTVIDAWEPPAADGARFVDSQIRGPYRCWWHEHRFERAGERTIMHDTVHYAPPFGPLGVIANHVVVASELRRIFAQRARAIRLRFG